MAGGLGHLIREGEGILSVVFLHVAIWDQMPRVTVAMGSYPIGRSPDNCQGTLAAE